MSYIERAQKRVFFEEAAKIGIQINNLLAAPEIYQKLFGVNDRGTQRYGLPLAPQYIAQADELIDISRLSSYFKGVGRDLRTLDVAITELEDEVDQLSFQLWAKTQLLKNRANTIQKTASAELKRSSDGGIWSYTEPFTSTAKIDMINTTAWIDTAEGICYIPNGTTESNVPPLNIRVLSLNVTDKVNMLGTLPAQAFDGLGSTGWKGYFYSNESIGCTVGFDSTELLTGVMVDPIGSGLELLIEHDDSGNITTLVKDTIYKKKTYPIEVKNPKNIKISFAPVSGNFPTIAGIRDLIFIKAKSSLSATLFTTVLKPSDSYSDVKIDLVGEIPTGATIKAYLSFNPDSLPWKELKSGVWNSVSDSGMVQLALDLDNVVRDPIYRGLAGIPVVSPSTSKNEGRIYVGSNQIEVSSFEKDWTISGDVPRILSPSDFNTLTVKKTWITPSMITERSGDYVIQPYGGTQITGSSLTRGVNICANRQISTPNDAGYGRIDAPYNEFLIVPLSGDRTKNSMQFGYNYRLRFSVLCEKDFYFGGSGSFGKFWFLQGYRKDGAKSYKEIGKSWGSVALYINGMLVTGSNQPETIYDTAPELRDNTATSGTSFSFSMKKGWNVVELLVSIVDPNSNLSMFTDPLDTADPYLQFSMTPNFFDPVFKDTYGILDIVGSGVYKPVSEFDLLWNLPRDNQFWAWDDKQSTILFNNYTSTFIDGFLNGELPKSLIEYRSSVGTVSDIHLKFEMRRESLSKTNPSLDQYTIGVR